MSTLQRNPPYLVEEIKNWSTAQVIKFLESKKSDWFLNENHIKIIENEEITGLAFLSLTKEDLRSYGLKGGPSTIITELIKNLKSEEQNSSIQEEQKMERLSALEDKLTSLQELLQKSGIQQKVEQFTHAQGKGKKRAVEHEQEYEYPTKVLKISSTRNVKTTLERDEMDVNNMNNEVNANTLLTNEDHKEPAYNYLVKGDINYFINLTKRHFQTRSMMSLKSMNEAVFQAVIEMLLPLTFRVPELRLIVDGTKQKNNGRFGFVDIFIPGGKDNPSIVLELKHINLTGLKSGSNGRFPKSLRTIELFELDKKLEAEDDDTVLKRKYMLKNSKMITVSEIMNNGILQLQNYIKIIARGPVKGYCDSGVLDTRVDVTKTVKDSGRLMGYVVMSVGTRRILVRSYGPITTDVCYFNV